MYRLIGNKRTRSFRVLWALHEMGLPFNHDPAPPRDPAVRALNGSGKVPVLVVGEDVLTDSTAILTFLADRHGQLTAPPGSIARARQDGMTQMLLDEFDSVLWAASKHSFILPEELRLPAVKESLRWEFAASAERVAERLDGPFLMGDAMTIADIICTHCLTWAIAARFAVTPPPLIDYLDRMRARPAWIAANG